MKKIKYLPLPIIFFISVILLTHFRSGHLLGESSKSIPLIKTDYHDLPADQAIVLKSLLSTGDLNSLSEKNLKLMERYFTRYVLYNHSQFGTNITSNYFWYIYNAIPEFVDKSERHQGYYADQTDLKGADRLLAYAIYRIDRSPENLRRLFNYARPLIKASISKENYHYSRLGDKVNGLLGIYSQIVKVDNYKEKMLNVSTKADMISGKIDSEEDYSRFRNSAYGFSCYDLADLICFEMGISRHDSDFCSPDWTFWMRRIREGNIEEGHSILVEISEMYRD